MKTRQIVIMCIGFIVLGVILFDISIDMRVELYQQTFDDIWEYGNDYSPNYTLFAMGLFIGIVGHLSIIFAVAILLAHYINKKKELEI